MKKNQINRAINILSLIFIGLGLFLLFRNGDWDKVAYVKDHLSYPGVMIVIMLSLVCQILVIFRWYLLLLPVKNNIRFKSIFRIAVSAILLNHVAPGKVGYPTKAFFLKKTEQIPISSSVPSLFGELILDYSVTGLLFIVAALAGNYFGYIIKLLSDYIALKNLWLFPLILIILLLLIFALKRRLQATNVLKNLITAIHLTRKRHDVLIWSLIITIIYLMIWFISDYILAASIGYKLPLIFLIFVGAFTNIIVLLAPLPGGLGVREISGAYLFKIFFNLGEVALIMILLSRLFTFITLALLYFGDRLFRLAASHQEEAHESPSSVEITGEIS